MNPADYMMERATWKKFERDAKVNEEKGKIS